MRAHPPGGRNGITAIVLLLLLLLAQALLDLDLNVGTNFVPALTRTCSVHSRAPPLVPTLVRAY